MSEMKPGASICYSIFISCHSALSHRLLEPCQSHLLTSLDDQMSRVFVCCFWEIAEFGPHQFES